MNEIVKCKWIEANHVMKWEEIDELYETTSLMKRVEYIHYFKTALVFSVHNE